MTPDPDRLAASPRQATTCPNCSRPMFLPRCAVCGWVDPDAPDDDEDDGDDFDTALFEPGLEPCPRCTGGGDCALCRGSGTVPAQADPPGGES